MAASDNTGSATLESAKGLTYAGSGVDIDAGDRFAHSIGSMMRRTFGPRVIQNDGGFAGLFRLDFNEKLFKRNYKDPVLVASTDGVGTKLKIATDMQKFDTIGIDLVAMCVNDLIVEGAEPLIFLDYLAIPKVDQGMLSALVKGVSDGCVEADALLGGETAEMPDVYPTGEFDMAGFTVGVLELNARSIQAGSSRAMLFLGLHHQGYIPTATRLFERLSHMQSSI